MIRDTISQIEKKLECSSSINPETRRELLGLLDTLNAEIDNLSQTNVDQARSIASLTETSTVEATRPERDPELLNDAVEKLRGSVEGFENTHPRLVEAINRIATTLAGLGI